MTANGPLTIVITDKHPHAAGANMADVRSTAAGEQAVSEPSISFRIARIARMQRARFDSRAKSLGLTRAQWRVMATVKLAEGATQREVASRLEVSGVTAGRIIDRLESDGWLERRQDTIDRRMNRLYTTIAAEPMLEHLTALGANEESTALDGIDADERVLLATLLDRLIDNMIAAPLPYSASDESDTELEY